MYVHFYYFVVVALFFFLRYIGDLFVNPFHHEDAIYCFIYLDNLCKNHKIFPTNPKSGKKNAREEENIALRQQLAQLP